MTRRDDRRVSAAASGPTAPLPNRVSPSQAPCKRGFSANS